MNFFKVMRILVVVAPPADEMFGHPFLMERSHPLFPIILNSLVVSTH